MSADRRLYSQSHLSRSYPSHLSANSVSACSSAVHRGSSDCICNSSPSSDVVTDRYPSLGVAPQYSVHKLSETVDRSRKLERVDSEEPELELSDIGDPGVVGIKNHGNTCYASSVIQCLSNTKYFTEHFVNDRHRARLMAAEQAGRRCAVTDGLAQLIESLWTRAYTSKLSRSLLKTVKQKTELFADSNGHDAEEFLMWLLNTVNDELYGTSEQEDDTEQVGTMLVPDSCSYINCTSIRIISVWSNYTQLTANSKLQYCNLPGSIHLLHFLLKSYFVTTFHSLIFVSYYAIKG